MLRPVILVFLSVVAISYGYEFYEPSFDEIIMEDLLEYADLGDSELHDRERRDLESSSRSDKDCKPRHRSCCEEPAFNETAHGKWRELKKECFQEIKQSRKEQNTEQKSGNGVSDLLTCEGLKRGKNHIACVMVCVGQKQKVLDESGNIVKDRMRAKMMNSVGPQWAKKVVDSSIDQCLDEVAKFSAKMADQTKPAGTCNKSSMKFSHCMFRALTMGCPADKQKDTEKCNKIRERMSNGEDLIQLQDFNGKH